MMPASSTDSNSDLSSRAAEVLRENDLGGWTKAAPRLYPHQWSWDSAFISVGWAHLDTRRAFQELVTLFDAQWTTGMVPHIVFNPAIPPGAYFPGPERWDCANLATAAPKPPPHTSGIAQPPVHAIAARHIRQVAERKGEADLAVADAFLRDLYPRLFSWHRFLATDRDPEGSGLVTIVHPWCGTDNSPRWDAALERVQVGELEPYERADLKHVADPSQRPTKEEYDRYLWLVELLKRARYDWAEVLETHPFLIKDVLFSAIGVAANEALLEIGGIVNAPDDEMQSIETWMTRGRRGLDERWDSGFGLCLDYDLRAAEPVRVKTIAGFAPLIAGGLSAQRRAALLATLESPAFLGHPDLRWPVPFSTSPEDPGFRARSYWRGPTWPFFNWLLWWALVQLGEADRADRLRTASLAQMREIDFAEYVEPFTGEPLGSLNQSWTAAVALDWLAGRS
jgi:hypothetical protein